jgi:hypothetical protein
MNKFSIGFILLKIFDLLYASSNKSLNKTIVKMQILINRELFFSLPISFYLNLFSKMKL